MNHKLLNYETNYAIKLRVLLFLGVEPLKQRSWVRIRARILSFSEFMCETQFEICHNLFCEENIAVKPAHIIARPIIVKRGLCPAEGHI